MFEAFESLTGICPHCLLQSVIMAKDHLVQSISYYYQQFIKN